MRGSGYSLVVSKGLDHAEVLLQPAVQLLVIIDTEDRQSVFRRAPVRQGNVLDVLPIELGEITRRRVTGRQDPWRQEVPAAGRDCAGEIMQRYLFGPDRELLRPRLRFIQKRQSLCECYSGPWLRVDGASRGADQK